MTRKSIKDLPSDIVVYTAVFGGYDRLKPARYPSVCITDFQQGALGWQYRGLLMGGTNKAKSFWAKSHPHILFPDAKYSIFHDGNVEMLISPRQLISETLKNNDIAVHIHPQRKCIYKEGEACVRLKRASRRDVDAQMEYLRRNGYPENNGLVDTVVLIRRHTPEIAELNECWWSEFERSPAKRDQLSFNFVCWKLGVDYYKIKGHPRYGGYFQWEKHRRARKPQNLKSLRSH
jgi:hypothetical protein